MTGSEAFTGRPSLPTPIDAPGGTVIQAAACEKRRKPEQLTQPVQFLVEGDNAWQFWTGMIRRKNLTCVQVHDFGGVGQLRGYLDVVRRTPGWERVRVLIVGQDAEKDAQAEWQRVAGALNANGLACPKTLFELAAGSPRTGAMLWPSPAKTVGSNAWHGSGALEDLCLACVPDERLGCTDAFLTCVEADGPALPARHKSRLQAYLAGTEHAGLRLCDATAAGAWDIRPEPLQPYLDFLRESIAAATAGASAAATSTEVNAQVSS